MKQLRGKFGDKEARAIKKANKDASKHSNSKESSSTSSTKKPSRQKEDKMKTPPRLKKGEIDRRPKFEH